MKRMSTPRQLLLGALLGLMAAAAIIAFTGCTTVRWEAKRTAVEWRTQ